MEWFGIYTQMENENLAQKIDHHKLYEKKELFVVVWITLINAYYFTFFTLLLKIIYVHYKTFGD